MTLHMVSSSFVPKVVSAFGSVTIELTAKNLLKRRAQVASSVAPLGSPSGAPRLIAGLHHRLPERKSRRSYGIKLKNGELELLKEKASFLGMSVNAYIRAKALGEDYIEKPPLWLRDVLLKLYVEMSRQGNDLNQIVRNVNRGFMSGASALAETDQQRTALFCLMKKLELALSGRRPPDDY